MTDGSSATAVRCDGCHCIAVVVTVYIVNEDDGRRVAVPSYITSDICSTSYIVPKNRDRTTRQNRNGTIRIVEHVQHICIGELHSKRSITPYY